MVPFPNALQTDLYEINFTVITQGTDLNFGFSAADLRSEYSLTTASATPFTVDLTREASADVIAVNLGSSALTGVELSFVSTGAVDTADN